MTSLPATTQTFVLVHGAWHGGWCWSRVAALLRAAGHTVFTPTLTGLGERSHLLNADITLQRSEEHTSELQSLMRISYAVFCLKKNIMSTSRRSSNSTTITI